MISINLVACPICKRNTLGNTDLERERETVCVLGEKGRNLNSGIRRIRARMGRVPCCDKVGLKKGPWTPEEDILLASHVQQHGSGNWNSVPIHTGLKRCGKSCRLRWTNYLRPGIKRGTFTHHEDKMIIQLQALFGNKWAAIASYLPERTDNDIKNYWNTHLKKRLNLAETGLVINTPRHALHHALSYDDSPDNDNLSQSPSSRTVQTTPSYASTADNMARLLKNWTEDKIRPQKKSISRDNYNSSCSSAFETPPAMEVDGVDDKGVFGFMDSVEFPRPGSDTTSGPDPVEVFTPVPPFDLEDWLIIS